MSARVALVTGVGPGTGAAIARRFAAGGYRVAMLARDRARLEALERDRRHGEHLRAARQGELRRLRADEGGAAHPRRVARARPRSERRARRVSRDPAAIADEIWHTAHQDRSAWSFLVDVRPFRESW